MATTAKKATGFKQDLEAELGTLPRILSEMVEYASTLETQATVEEEEEPMPPGEVRVGKLRPDFIRKGGYFRKEVIIDAYTSPKVKTTLKALFMYIDKLEAKLP